MTWSEFIPKAQKVVDANGVSMIASSGGSEMLMEMLQSAGSSPLQDGKVNVAGNAALKEAMTQYKAMVDAGIIAEYTDWDQYIASMNDGKTAGVVNGCWIMSSIQAAADQSGKWAIVNMPNLMASMVLPTTQTAAAQAGQFLPTARTPNWLTIS